MKERAALTRRASPSVPFFYPDWLVVDPLRRAVRDTISRYARGIVVDLGCGNSPFYEALSEQCARYIGVDLDAGPRTEIVSSIDALPLESASVDTALCSQVFEHVAALDPSIAEIARILKPGGALLLSVPQYSADHEVPHDFRRFTIFGLEELSTRHGFDLVEHRRQGGAFAVAALAINGVIVERVLGARTRSLGWLAKAAICVPFFIIANATASALDRVLPSERDCANHLVVLRRNQTLP